MMSVNKKSVEILIIVLGTAFIVYRFFMLRADTHPMADTTKWISVEMSRLNEITKVATQADRGVRTRIENVRNIFRKPGESAGAGTGTGVEPSGAKDKVLSLEGIIWGQNKNIAIISGVVVVEGDTVEGAKIVKIEPDKVIIFKNGVESELKRGM